MDMAIRGGERSDSELTVFTIGHSTRPILEFIRMLEANGIELLVDVRTVPRSRHNPQYNQEALAAALENSKLRYRYMAGLGGFRRPSKDATDNLAWRNLSFRGYADYMQTPEFAGQLVDLMALARSARVAIMCAEAVPWRCHRSLIADALLARGVEVREISSMTQAKALTLHTFAKVNGTRVTYPGDPTLSPAT
jgi:uncharacterized protein (DUF488 family)